MDEGYRLYVVAAGITDKTQQRALLLHCGGPDVQEIFQTLENTGNADDPDTALRVLTTYFQPKKNIPFERHVFPQAKQGEDESTDSFVTRLKRLAKTCEFGVFHDDIIRDQVIEKGNSTN